MEQLGDSLTLFGIMIEFLKILSDTIMTICYFLFSF